MIYFILFWGILHTILFIISWFRISNNNKDIVEFLSTLAYPIGVFVWEDLLVFSIFNIFLTVISVINHDVRIGLLFLLIFWVVRSAGETLYFFLQQFIRPKHHPHDISKQLGPIRKIFGDISDQKCYILCQVFFQTVCIISLGLLILLLINWNNTLIKI